MKLNSKDNKLIKLAKKLHNKKDRKENNLFIIEGEKLIKDAIKSKVSISTIFIKENIDLSFESKSEVFEISDELMSYISTTESSPPCLALAKIEHKEIKKENNLVLVLNDLQDPGNLGTILRSAEASGVDLVVASKTTTDVYNPKVIRSAMGASFRVPFMYVEDINIFILNLKQDNFKIIMTSPYAKDNFHEFKYSGKIALFIGNEGQGLQKELLKNFNSIKIPMMGEVESLNTSIATSIILYEILKQRLLS